MKERIMLYVGVLIICGLSSVSMNIRKFQNLRPMCLLENDGAVENFMAWLLESGGRKS